MKPGSAYRIQFYGSRFNLTNYTVFTIGTVTKRINTSNNFTDVADFTGVIPATDGSVKVTVAVDGQFSYLAGFTITEEESGRATMGMQGANNSISNEAGDPVLKYAYDVQLYPNPVQSNLTVTTTIPSDRTPMIITIVDMSGKVLYTKEVVASKKTETQINMASFKDGIYTLSVKVAGKTLSRQVIKGQ
jgi:hypothetical protein